MEHASPPADDVRQPSVAAAAAAAAIVPEAVAARATAPDAARAAAPAAIPDRDALARAFPTSLARSGATSGRDPVQDAERKVDQAREAYGAAHADPKASAGMKFHLYGKMQEAVVALSKITSGGTAFAGGGGGGDGSGGSGGGGGGGGLFGSPAATDMSFPDPEVCRTVNNNPKNAFWQYVLVVSRTTNSYRVRCLLCHWGGEHGAVVAGGTDIGRHYCEGCGCSGMPRAVRQACEQLNATNRLSSDGGIGARDRVVSNGASIEALCRRAGATSGPAVTCWTERCKRAFVNWVVADCIPKEKVQSSFLADLIDAVSDGCVALGRDLDDDRPHDEKVLARLPRKTAITETWVPDLYERCLNRIRRTLAGCYYASLTYDGYFQRAADTSVVALMAHKPGSAGFPLSMRQLPDGSGLSIALYVAAEIDAQLARNFASWSERALHITDDSDSDARQLTAGTKHPWCRVQGPEFFGILEHACQADSVRQGLGRLQSG